MVALSEIILPDPLPPLCITKLQEQELDDYSFDEYECLGTPDCECDTCLYCDVDREYEDDSYRDDVDFVPLSYLEVNYE